MSLRSTCLSNVFAVNAIGSPENSLDLQAPHIASDAGRSGATRLTAEQWGQTAWSGSDIGRASCHRERSVAIQGNIGRTLRSPGSPRRFAPREDGANMAANAHAFKPPNM
jgi:hypothetical protein